MQPSWSDCHSDSHNSAKNRENVALEAGPSTTERPADAALRTRRIETGGQPARRHRPADPRGAQPGRPDVDAHPRRAAAHLPRQRLRPRPAAPRSRTSSAASARTSTPSPAGLGTSAYVTVNLRQAEWRAVGEQLRALPGRRAHRAGRRRVRRDPAGPGPDNADLRRLVLDEIQGMPGVVTTRTLLVFEEHEPTAGPDRVTAPALLRACTPGTGPRRHHDRRRARARRRPRPRPRSSSWSAPCSPAS